ncbi:MAG: thiamine phosphate synthase [Vicingaceae bacterium]
MIEKLQYITQETDSLSHIDCVREACIAGVKWVQLRVKNKSDEDYLEIAKEAKIICDLYDVILIINDNVAIAKEINAHGVHLGKADMYISEARSILGEDAIIGGTANILKDVERLIDQKANYIGLGPFKFTETKKNLSPVLGLEGYEKIINDLKTFYSIDETPIIAIGGIDVYDIDPLLDTGVFGIAVSGLLTNDFSITEGLLKTIDRKSFKLEVLIKK